MTTPDPQPRPPPRPSLSSQIPKLTPRRRPPRPSSSDLAPAPPTPPLPSPPDLKNHTYIHPSRRILGPEDHASFLASPTCTLIQAWIFGLSDAVRDRSVRSVRQDGEEVSSVVRKILWVLDEVGAVLAQHPAEDTGSRFGNPAFRSFVDDVGEKVGQWHAHLGLSDPSQIDEVSTYLHSAFGNRARLDYGSGHELNFLLWLLCLNRLGLLPPPTFPALGLVVLPAYLRLMRAVQAAYYLEPAGSHGVWGLDDYQFMPFLVGASQLVGHAWITPKAIHNALVLEEEGRDYVYLDQVAFVNSVKNVEGLRWHSPMLDDISAARSWAKIEAGMRKMFVKEILGKLPVMQHFLFGSLVAAEQGMSRDVGGDGEEEGGDGTVEVYTDDGGRRHVHANTGWGDCCGIRVPAAIGAEGEERKGGGQRLRRLPFD